MKASGALLHRGGEGEPGLEQAGHEVEIVNPLSLEHRMHFTCKLPRPQVGPVESTKRIAKNSQSPSTSAEQNDSLRQPISTR